MDADNILYGSLLDYLHPRPPGRDSTLLAFAARKSGLGQIGHTPTFHIGDEAAFALLFLLEEEELALYRQHLSGRREPLYLGGDIATASERAEKELRDIRQDWIDLSEKRVRDMVWRAIPRRYLAGGFSD